MSSHRNTRRLAAPILTATILAGAALGLAGTAVAQPTTDTTHFGASGVTASIDCGDNGALQIDGSHDVLTTTGTCSSLHVAGDANRITVQKVTATIDLSGNGNTVDVQADFDGSNLLVTGDSNDLDTGTGTGTGTG